MSKKNNSFTLDGKEIELQERRKARREVFLSLNLQTRIIEDKRKKDEKYKKFEDE